MHDNLADAEDSMASVPSSYNLRSGDRSSVASNDILLASTANSSVAADRFVFY